MANHLAITSLLIANHWLVVNNGKIMGEYQLINLLLNIGQ